jgi:peptide subunit release factor 1 (eRF1)
VVRQDGIERIIVAGDEVVIPLFKQELTPYLAERLVDIVRLDIAAPEREVLETTLSALRRGDAETDAQAVDQLFDTVRSDALGVVGPDETLQALERGQVDELLIVARPEALSNVDHLAPSPERPHAVANAAQGLAVDDVAARAADRRERVPTEDKVADQLVTLARQTASRVRFIEDPALLAEVGGVGALLRFRMD